MNWGGSFTPSQIKSDNCAGLDHFPMTVYAIDPLTDERWREFLHTHPAASVFHTPEWLGSLQKTYGYEPVAFTTTSTDFPLANGILFCRISRLFGGRRLVSLPYSDHCEPLVENAQNLDVLMDHLRNSVRQGDWNSVEIRMPDCSQPKPQDFDSDTNFYFHKLDLRPDLDHLLGNFHKDCIQRKVNRAIREELRYEQGISNALLDTFYRLLVMTRRRHGLPPQPLSWFRNLIDGFGDKIKIRVALKHGRPVASILTLQYKKTLIYKYSCSDHSLSHLGGTQFLIWKAIQEAKALGLEELDMGRSDCANAGLVKFKDRWGATRMQMIYEWYPSRRRSYRLEAVLSRLGKAIFPYVPDGLLTMSGRLLYRYIG